MAINLAKPATSSAGLNERSTIVVADTRSLLRSCVVRTLKTEFPDHDVVEVESPRDCVRLQPEPRLIILGLRFDYLTDNAVRHSIQHLRQLFPSSPVALLGDDDVRSLAYAERFDCAGYLPTSLPLEIAVAALRLVLVGGTYLPHLRSAVMATDHEVSDNVAEIAAPPPQPAPANLHVLRPVAPLPITRANEVPGFTPREVEVIDALRRGRSNKIIASELSLSENTIKVHVRHIMRKLNATNRTQAALRSQALRDIEIQSA
jgi:DNA-binding NarL/FixJ family response regulator